MQQSLLIALTVVDALLITLSQVALWQRKEYRLDRMKAHLTSPEGSLRKHVLALLAGVVFLLAWLSSTPIAELFAAASLLLVLVSHGARIVKKGVMRPDLTLRAVLVMACVGIVSAVWFMVVGTSGAFHLAMFIFFLPLLIALCVWGITIPASMQKQALISKARTYRERLRDLTVIGITGSVGKTSTKTYLIHLLGGESETVVATSKHRNSPYSVAGDMLSRLSQTTRIYIAEMGAYVPGEIAELAELTKPTIGIITAITNQHVSLFGSLEALAKTKWELIRALPETGFAIVNKDDAVTLLQARDMKQKAVWFSSQEEADVYARDIVLTDDHIECDICIAGQAYSVQLPIISKGQLVSVLAAVAGAHALHSDSRSIIDRMSTLPSLPRTMELRAGVQGATIIDDSYSASEASVQNAIDYLQNSTAEDKRLVLVPIIELGTEGSSVHERIGKQLSVLAAHVCVYGDAYKKDIMRGLGDNPQAHVVWFDDVHALRKAVTAGMGSKTAIVLEGRVPAIIRAAVIPDLLRPAKPESEVGIRNPRSLSGSRLGGRDDETL